MDDGLKKIIDDIENNRQKGLEYLLSNGSKKIVSILNKSINKKEISEKEAEELFLIEDVNDLSLLVVLADKIRKEDVGDDVTYVVNRNINFTNKCNTYCGFCKFMADEGYERA